ncbi:hypothetical protein D1115_06585 [Vibrio alfacsensis]|uniref:Uncharacterized protein n=1 Tax=Vibrio alfacsensis TaxID=1074311 RepID=A0ABN5PD29_9VIBR|nr:hypothetical protein [Vibrio alfacsensis]AXY00945.1 hypothetical protein D1115_06585 [Vibrio alfacsensis]
MNLKRVFLVLGLSAVLVGCGDDAVTQIKESPFCDGSSLTFEDTLSLKYDKSLDWSEFETKKGQHVVEVNGSSIDGKSLRMQYVVKETASGKIVPKPEYIEVNGKPSNIFGLLFLCV